MALVVLCVALWPSCIADYPIDSVILTLFSVAVTRLLNCSTREYQW